MNKWIPFLLSWIHWAEEVWMVCGGPGGGIWSIGCVFLTKTLQVFTENVVSRLSKS
jgi:hypothetical protein